MQDLPRWCLFQCRWLWSLALPQQRTEMKGEEDLRAEEAAKRGPHAVRMKREASMGTGNSVSSLTGGLVTLLSLSMKMAWLFLLDWAFVVSTLSQTNYSCWLSPDVDLSALLTLQCLWSSKCVKPPPKTPFFGFSAPILVPFIQSSLICLSKILRIHIRSHHPCLNPTGILTTLWPQGLCTCCFFCLDLQKDHTSLSLRSLLKCNLLGETFPAQPT